jgi:hypothetical protein
VTPFNNSSSFATATVIAPNSPNIPFITPPPGTTLNLAAVPVPEASTLCLFGFTLAGFGLKRQLLQGGRSSTAARGAR